MSERRDGSHAGRNLILLALAFFGIFIYGLISALPGSVLPTLERSLYLPNDSAVATFLLINAVGALVAYLVSGPVIDRVGMKTALAGGALTAVAALAGLGLAVTKVAPTAALASIFICSLLLGLGANAIVSSGHALVADIASTWRNAALNLLDICFGLGLAALPLAVQSIQERGGLGLVFTSMTIVTGLLVVGVLFSKFPRPAHPESHLTKEAGQLISMPSFWLLAAALFMYVGAEVSVGKWVVTFLERDARLLAGAGLDAARLGELARTSPDGLSAFFERDPAGVGVATYALRTLSFFAFALLAGRLASSLLLGVARVNSLILLTLGSALTTLGLVLAFTAETPAGVRWWLVAAGFGMGPIFPTSVGLASALVPKIAGTAISLVMAVGFAGLLLIPPAVGYISSAAGGATGDVRTGLWAVVAASALMFLLHLVLMLRERSRAR